MQRGEKLVLKNVTRQYMLHCLRKLHIKIYLCVWFANLTFISWAKGMSKQSFMVLLDMITLYNFI